MFAANEVSVSGPRSAGGSFDPFSSLLAISAASQENNKMMAKARYLKH